MSEVATRYAVEESVATITLDRPERHNAWTTGMGEQYFDHLERAATDPDVRAIVVTGAGRSFCPGLDMGGLAAVATAGEARGGTRPQTFPLGIPKPILAAINGACAGIGLSLALPSRASLDAMRKSHASARERPVWIA